MKKFLLCVIALLVLAVPCAGADYWEEGHSGDSWEDAYIIDSAEDFKLLRDRSTQEKGKYYKLAADIDLSSETKWENSDFYGHLDGQNHKITVNMNNPDDMLMGLFAGVIVNEDEIALENINLEGTLIGYCAAGFVHDLMSGIIENCNFNGTIIASMPNYGAGGIVGEMYGGIVRNCTVKGKITSDYYAGGIVQQISGGQVINCTSTGTEISGARYSGGIAGWSSERITSISKHFSGNTWDNSLYPQIGNYRGGEVVDGIGYIMGHIYKVIEQPMTWEEAEEYCEELGGHLATISDMTEQEFLSEMIIASGDKNFYWLGGEKDSQGNWSWIDGTSFDYTNWAEGEPDNTNGNEDKLMMYRLSSPLRASEPGNWNDLNNNGTCGTEEFFGVRNVGFICEWDPVSADFAPLDEEYILWRNDPEAYFEDDFYGELPSPINMSHLEDNPPQVSGLNAVISENLPVKYDPRDLGKTFSVRDQNPYGTCWAFASLGALETSYLAQGFGKTVPDTSELHQAWFVYKDPRPGYSYKMDELEPDKHPVFDQGGYCEQSVAFLSRAGTARESDLEYKSAANVENLTKGKYPENYPHPLRISEAYTLGKITASNRNEVKNLIKDYGAVRIAYRHKHVLDEYYSARSYSYYYPGTEKKLGHAVIIVGWDDNYPLSNFPTQPNSNGAWLAKNSWGDIRKDFDKGYFWISYEQDIYNSAVFIAARTSSSLTCMGYDTLPAEGTINYHWSANVFKAEGNESIREIAFYTRDNNVDYEIYANKLGSSRPLNPGIPDKPILEGREDYAGYHTIELDNPIEIPDGEYFSVILKLSNSSGYKYTTAVETSEVRTAAIVNVGESYFAVDASIPKESDWKDGKTITDGNTSKPVNACIKVFTSSENSPDDPDDPDDPNNPVSSGGGSGGCSAGFGILALTALALLLKKH
ncbi:MAG: hypothetical protein IJU15_04545 [Synergistaceae bacterium]|nr:hypothetical protein [Synergistaceae bacterium]